MEVRIAYGRGVLPLRLPDGAATVVEPSHRDGESLHAAVPGLASHHGHEDGQRGVARDRVLEQSDDEGGEERGREVDLEPGEPLMDREGVLEAGFVLLAVSFLGGLAVLVGGRLVGDRHRYSGFAQSVPAGAVPAERHQHLSPSAR